MFQVTKNSKTCEKLIFRDIVITKARQNLKGLDQPISYTTAREHNHFLLQNIGLDLTKFGFHSLKTGGARASANLGESDSTFKKQRQWNSEKVKDSYAHKDLKLKLSMFKNLAYNHYHYS